MRAVFAVSHFVPELIAWEREALQVYFCVFTSGWRPHISDLYDNVKPTHVHVY